MRAFSKSHGFALLLAASLALAGGAARAQQQLNPDDQSGAATPPPPEPSPPTIKPAYYGGMQVGVGSGKLIKLPHAVSNIFAADPDIIEVRPASPDTMFVFGRKEGETTIVATDADGNVIAQYSVEVNPSNYDNDRISATAQSAAPGSNVTGEAEANGLIVQGTVQTPEQAYDIMHRAQIIDKDGTIYDELQVQQPIQVELKVRIASMSRTVTRELGIDWGSVGGTAISIGKFALTGDTASSAPAISGSTPGGVALTFPGGTFEGVIDALASDNLAHILAEPTLTTLSGTQATFQSGGQFPIPVASTDNFVTITYQNYGVILSFTPTVFSDGRIALTVAPQISSISTANSAVLSSSGSTEGIVVPSLNITQASSTVILGSGQGMAIAGLLQDTTNDSDNGVPGLSEVPLLGSLFRGDSFQRTQTELVITVTPYLVNPVNNPGALASPDDGWTPPNDLQRILWLRDNGTDSASTTIPGDAGFMVQ
jgi:pilus assembly protein CpaC